MRLLILGGTRFVGRELVEAALARGHAITLFNRGQHNPDLFPDVEKLRGDRAGNLSALRGRQWDAVIDTCGYVPRIVKASAELLAKAVKHYTFISSISVYADPIEPHFTEAAPVRQLADPNIEEVNEQTYGGLKVLCEQAVEQALPDRTLIIRPGLIVGPHDPTDRFTYWPQRVAQGGEVLAPGDPDQPVQFIDVRDLAEWVVRLVEARRIGIFHATGPAYTLSLRRFLDECQAAANNAARFSWVAEQFLLDAGAVPWSELPLWVPAAEAGLNTADCRKATEAGLMFRSLTDTIRDTLRWAATRPANHEWQAGLPAEKETKILDAWHAR
jgi:2'-hydroxyisoflavone reductase